MSNTIIRLGTAVDREPAIAVWQAAGLARRGGKLRASETVERVRASFRKPDLFLLIAERDAQIIGMATGMHGLEDRGAGPVISGLCHIGLVYVLPLVWGQGIGGRLVDAVMAEACARGYDRAQLWTQADNERALRLYTGRGFIRTGLTGTGGDDEAIVHLVRALT